MHVLSIVLRYYMSNYGNPELRYPCFSEPGLVSHSHPRSLSLRVLHETNNKFLNDFSLLFFEHQYLS